METIPADRSGVAGPDRFEVQEARLADDGTGS